jgi:hypothetical protein
MTNIPEENKNGNCYEEALNLFMNMISTPEVKLVHGIVTGQGAVKGIKFGHAWVEFKDFCIDKSNGNSIMQTKEVYYRIGKIKKVKRYIALEAMKNIQKFGTYGPWDKNL